MKYKKDDGVYRYYCKAGVYEASSMFRLIFSIYLHRLWHLLKHRKWMD